MQDRAPPHFAVVVCEWPNAQFPAKPMGRRRPHEWPAKSPDLTVNTLRLFLKNKFTQPNQEIWKNFKGEFVKF